MSKAYWISFYREVKDPAKLAAYAKLAAPAIIAGGGVFLARGVAETVFEAGQKERITLIEFESLEKALLVHESPEYQKALAALGDGVVRDLRIVPGLT
jgi:uncharacterized protein (DUF1330 family)